MHNANIPPQLDPPRARPRFGCLGRLVIFFLVGSATVLLIYAVFAPWAFFLGGHFHPFAYWQGWGRMKSSTAGDYVLFVRMFPAPGSYPHQSWHLTGRAYLCTPKGERFRLNLGGDMPRHFGTSSVGEPIHLYMYYWPIFYPQVNLERRPRIQFWGTWGESELRMDDHKSLSAAFLPDGTLNTRTGRNRPSGTEDVTVTLREGSYSDFDSACPAKPR